VGGVRQQRERSRRDPADDLGHEQDGVQRERDPQGPP